MRSAYPPPAYENTLAILAPPHAAAVHSPPLRGASDRDAETANGWDKAEPEELEPVHTGVRRAARRAQAGAQPGSPHGREGAPSGATSSIQTGAPRCPR